MLNEAYEMVKVFQTDAGQPVSNVPRRLEKERVNIRAKWMSEELQEFLTAPDLYSQADAIIDLLYYLLGTCVEMGIKPDILFQIVHESNMKKILSGGFAIKDSDGKVQKPPSWTHPDASIIDAINSMLTAVSK